MGAFLARVEYEGEKTHSVQHPKTREYLEDNNIQTQMHLRQDLQPRNEFPGPQHHAFFRLR